MAENFVLKGNICYSQDAQTCCDRRTGLSGMPGGQVGRSVQRTSSRVCSISTEGLWRPDDCSGLVDLHIHAPQYSFRGLGMDLELLEWLNTRTFPEEAKYRDAEYAKKAYTIFADNMKRSATTRACIFATLHREATKY